MGLLFLPILVSVLQRGMPVDIFRIKRSAPATAVFGLCFISLFSGMLIARDRSSSFLTRLFASPLSAADWLIAYSLLLVGIALAQTAVCYIAAFFFGHPVTIEVLATYVVPLPVAVLFIGLGLLLDSVVDDRVVGGVFSLLAYVVGFLSGMWLDLNSLGGTLKAIAYAMPVAHAVDAAELAFAGDLSSALPHLVGVIVYAVAIFVPGIFAFKGR